MVKHGSEIPPDRILAWKELPRKTLIHDGYGSGFRIVVVCRDSAPLQKRDGERLEIPWFRHCGPCAGQIVLSVQMACNRETRVDGPAQGQGMRRTHAFNAGKSRKLRQEFVVERNFARVRITLVGDRDIEGDCTFRGIPWSDRQYVTHRSNQKPRANEQGEAQRSFPHNQSMMK